MSSPVTTPVRDSVSKVNDEIAVGADLEFQRKWWVFERVVWSLFALILILNLAGVFGKGPVAKARRQAQDRSMEVEYERVERYGTPSVLTIAFHPTAIQNGRIKLWASESLVKSLGNQRVVPQPASSVIGQGGILYTFDATTIPASVEFQLEPTSLGLTKLTLGVPGFQNTVLNIFTMP